jgi:hypothetical protein
MSNEILKFKEGLKYKFEGYSKILHGIELENTKEESNTEIIDEILNAFEVIKRKIDMIAHQRMKEIKLSKSQLLNSQFSYKHLLARYNQFKTE